MPPKHLDDDILRLYRRLATRGLTQAPEPDEDLAEYLRTDRAMAVDWLPSWIWPPLARRAEDVQELAEVVQRVHLLDEPEQAFRHLITMLGGSVGTDIPSADDE